MMYKISSENRYAKTTIGKTENKVKYTVRTAHLRSKDNTNDDNENANNENQNNGNTKKYVIFTYTNNWKNKIPNHSQTQM